MKMINNSFKIVATTVLFMTAGCTDILKKPLENQPLTSSTDYTKTAEMNNPILGLYADWYKVDWPVIPLVSVLGDDVNPSGDQPPFQATDLYTYDATFWMYNSVWSDLYGRVFTAHNAIEQTLKYKAFAPNKALADQYIAEARVIRAFQLYHLTKTWGPIFIPTNSDPMQLHLAKVATQEEALKHIVAEMDTCALLLPDLHPNARTDFKGGVTKYTALAIKAMAHLMLKNYQGVADATSIIISSNKFSLEPDLYELFNTKGKLNNENLFELQAANLKDYVPPLSFYGPPNWFPKIEEAAGGWGFWEPSLKYVKFMLNRNETVRLETSVIFTPRGITALGGVDKMPKWIQTKMTTVTTGSGDQQQIQDAYKNKYKDTFIDSPRQMFLSGKHYLPSEQLNGSQKDYGANKNRVLIRYAEILLMHAEALTRGATGSGKTAIDAVNLVRARAKMLPLTNVTVDDVMAEKYAELAMELGTRYADMTRLQKYDELSYDGRIFTADKVHLPYPQGQVDKLPILGTIKNN